MYMRARISHHVSHFRNYTMSQHYLVPGTGLLLQLKCGSLLLGGMFFTMRYVLRLRSNNICINGAYAFVTSCCICKLICIDCIPLQTFSARAYILITPPGLLKLRDLFYIKRDTWHRQKLIYAILICVSKFTSEKTTVRQMFGYVKRRCRLILHGNCCKDI